MRKDRLHHNNGQELAFQEHKDRLRVKDRPEADFRKLNDQLLAIQVHKDHLATVFQPCKDLLSRQDLQIILALKKRMDFLDDSGHLASSQVNLMPVIPDEVALQVLPFPMVLLLHPVKRQHKDLRRDLPDHKAHMVFLEVKSNPEHLVTQEANDQVILKLRGLLHNNLSNYQEDLKDQRDQVDQAFNYLHNKNKSHQLAIQEEDNRQAQVSQLHNDREEHQKHKVRSVRKDHQARKVP